MRCSHDTPKLIIVTNGNRDGNYSSKMKQTANPLTLLGIGRLFEISLAIKSHKAGGIAQKNGAN
jgi:hypothetical protein